MIKSGSKSDRGLGWFARVAALGWAWTWLDQISRNYCTKWPALTFSWIPLLWISLLVLLDKWLCVTKLCHFDLTLVHNFLLGEFRNKISLFTIFFSSFNTPVQGSLGQLPCFVIILCFSLRSCRSSSVNLLYFWGEIWREVCGIFSGLQNKGSKHLGKIRSIFTEKIRASTKNIFCQLRSADAPP